MNSRGELEAKWRRERRPSTALPEWFGFVYLSYDQALTTYQASPFLRRSWTCQSFWNLILSAVFVRFQNWKYKLKASSAIIVLTAHLTNIPMVSLNLLVNHWTLITRYHNAKRCNLDRKQSNWDRDKDWDWCYEKSTSHVSYALIGFQLFKRVIVSLRWFVQASAVISVHHVA